MKKIFKLEVFIGGGYVFQRKDSIACVFIPIGDSVYLPGYGVHEFDSIFNAGTRVADFYDFYKEYIDKDVCKEFVVEIHLNVKSNKKTFYGRDAIDAIDRINAKYSPELREF